MLSKYCKISLFVVSLILMMLCVILVHASDWLVLSYGCRIDGLSFSFVILTSALTPICLLASWEKPVSYFILFLILEAIVIAFFLTSNLVVFYVLFELSLVPMFFIIGIWGSDRRIYAAYKFFLYTFVASIPFLFALIYIYVDAGTMDMHVLSEYLPKLGFSTQLILWISFFVAFAVKIPMWPLHTWLPDAHVQAPTAGSVMLAGVLIKLGGYGMFRVLLPMFPEVSFYLKDWIFVFSIIAVLYASLVAFAQTDMKKLIAYSSIAHMGFVTAGLFSATKEGVTGAVFQMLSHGITSAALFLCIGLLYSRMHSRNISDYNGLANTMPIFSFIFILFSMASIGLPGLSGFIGEFLTIIGLFKYFKIHAMFIASGTLLGAVYMLSLCKRIIWGKSEMLISDLSVIEVVMFLPLILFTFAMGIAPNLFLDFIGVDSILFNINLLK